MKASRQDVTLFNEGHLITLAAQQTPEDAIEHARGSIDGCFNALLRLGAAEDAAGFAYACGDRMVDRSKQPTAWPLAPKVVDLVIAVPPPQVEPKSRWFGFWRIFAIGFVTGVGFGVSALLIIANLAVHR